MKKCILVLALALSICLTSVPPTVLAFNELIKSEPSPSDTQLFDLTQEDIQAFNDAWAILEAWAKAQGWDGNSYGNWIVGVWDSEVLPDCVPNEIPGIKAEQTTYKEKHHGTYSNNYYTGNVFYSNSNYEEWGLQFYCTNDQLNAFIGEMAANGFYGGQTSSGYYPEYEWIGNGYYAYMRVNTYIFGEKDYDNLAFFDITWDNNNPRPIAFQGTKLPNFGVVTWDYSEGIGWGWNYATDTEVENFWNLFTDSGVLPDDWSMWIDYFGVTLDQTKAYAQQMKAQGWEIIYEYEGEDWDGEVSYVCQLRKGNGLIAGLEFRNYGLNVGFASMGEMLWY